MVQEGIPFAGQLEEKEYRALMRAARPAFLKLLPWLILASLVVVLVMGGPRSLLASPAEQIPRVVICLFLVGVLFVAPEMTIRASWKKNALAHEPVSGAVTREGIRWEGGASKATFAWSGLRGVRERKELLLVYTTSSQAFWLLPRFFATPGDWNRARERVVANLQRR
jgi:hypothetical protein